MATTQSSSTTAFSIEGLAALVRERAWAYLTASAIPLHMAAVAEDLFRLPRGDLRRLAAVHVGMADETEAMLEAAEHVLRELPSTIARSRIELRGAVRPPVLWRDTQLRRFQTGDRSLFVCAPAERRYDTPLARLVKLALEGCRRAHDAGGLGGKGSTGETLAYRAMRATRLQRHAKLRDVRLVRTLPAHSLRGASRFPHASELVNFVSLYREAVEDQSPRTLREVVTRQLLVPHQPDRLFELHVGFEIIDALAANGYRQVEHRLLPSTRQPFARFRGPGETEATLWYQRSIANALKSSPAGRYQETLGAAGLAKSSLRPDFILVRGHESLLVEAKFTELEGQQPDRVGIKDSFTYLHDSEAVLRAARPPRALVVAWNSKGRPSSADVVVTSQHMIRDAIDLVLRDWETAF